MLRMHLGFVDDGDASFGDDASFDGASFGGLYMMQHHVTFIPAKQ